MKYRYIFLYIALFIGLTLCFCLRPFTIQTDIIALLPITEDSDSRQAAFNHISNNSMGTVNILFAAKDIDASKEAGLYFASQLEGAELRYEIDTDYASFLSILKDYNYRLLSEQNRKLISLGKSNEIADAAISMLYSPAGASVLSFEDDPFTLATDYVFSSPLLKSGFSPSRGVLSSAYNDKIYTYMTLEIAADELFSPGRLAEKMQLLSAAKAATITNYPDVGVSISGIPVHTWHASSSSTDEMTIISIISIILVLIISLTALRSPFSFLVLMVTIVLSFAVAFMTTATILGGIHVLTLVFGTSLVGLSTDYMLHYLVERGSGVDALKSITAIQVALALSLATTLLGFSAMLFSNMLLLRQMALFSMSGLICAWLLVLFFYPIIFKSLKPGAPLSYVLKMERTLSKCMEYIVNKHGVVKLLIFILICVAGISKIQINDDISNLYKPTEALIAAEKLFHEVNKENISLMFFFVSGDDSGQVLADEEKLLQALEIEVQNGNLKGFKAISQLLPSPYRQRENLLLSESLWREQAAYLKSAIGLTDEQMAFMQAKLMQQTKTLTVETLLDIEQLNVLKNFWIDGKGSIVLLKAVKNPAELAKYENANIYFLDKLGDLNKAMASYRYKLTMIFFVACLLIMAVLILRFGVRRGFVGSLAPFFAVLTSLAALGFAGVSISLFHVLALFLVLCFGVDYTVFQMETKGKLQFAGLAVMLSCLTTLASFGLLAFTQFEVTRALGLTLFIGILTAYLYSIVVRRVV